MPLPVVNVGGNPLATGNVNPPPRTGNVGDPNPVPAPGVPDNPVNQQGSQAVPNFAGPNLQPGDGQARNFAAVHVSNYGRNWDLESADGMRKTAQKAVAKIKSMISGSAAFDEYVKSVERAVVDALRRADESGVNVGDADRNEIKRQNDRLLKPY